MTHLNNSTLLKIIDVLYLLILNAAGFSIIFFYWFDTSYFPSDSSYDGSFLLLGIALIVVGWEKPLRKPLKLVVGNVIIALLAAASKYYSDSIGDMFGPVLALFSISLIGYCLRSYIKNNKIAT